MVKASEHPNNPANQRFNVAAERNRAKSRSSAWWGHPPYNNNGAKAKREK